MNVKTYPSQENFGSGSGNGVHVGQGVGSYGGMGVATGAKVGKSTDGSIAGVNVGSGDNVSVAGICVAVGVSVTGVVGGVEAQAVKVTSRNTANSVFFMGLLLCSFLQGTIHFFPHKNFKADYTENE